MRCGPSCLWRGVCPRDIAMIAIAALDCAFRRPRRLQPTTLPVAALWMAALYHPVTKASLAKSLSRSLPPLARRPLLPPVTTRFATIAPDRRPGSDRRHARSSRTRAHPCAITRSAHRTGCGLRKRSARLARQVDSTPSRLRSDAMFHHEDSTRTRQHPDTSNTMGIILLRDATEYSQAVAVATLVVAGPSH